MSSAIISKDAMRLTIRSLAKLAGEIVASYWPIRTFVHHNPLHELEHMHFFEALERAHVFLGARRHLPSNFYRQRFRDGVIKPNTLEKVLSETTENASIEIGSNSISKLSLRRALLVDGIEIVSEPQLQSLWEADSQRELLQAIAATVKNELPANNYLNVEVQKSLRELEQTTLIHWVDQSLGTDWESILNREMSRWCAAFLDEGEAVWSMPHRGQGFYKAWKNFSQLGDFTEWGSNWQLLVKSLPESPEDALIDILEKLKIPEDQVIDYFAAHLCSLSGWASFIKWRSAQQAYAWQQYPMDLVQYLAVRLVYEYSIVSHLCKERFAFDGNYNSIKALIGQSPLIHLLLRAKAQGSLSDSQMREVDRAMHSGQRPLSEKFREKFLDDFASSITEREARCIAWRLRRLCQLVKVDVSELSKSRAEDLLTLSTWLDEFSENEQGIVWLKANEAEYQENLFKEVSRSIRQSGSEGLESDRPQAQAVFCIDVRCEPFRRHLESVGKYETYGFAGFFNCFIRYKPLDSEYESNQFPVVMKARNIVREVPRPYHQAKLAHYQRGRQLLHAMREALHDLKANLITPYVTVESLGWVYLFPFMLKTLAPTFFSNLCRWSLHSIQEPISTSLTVDKLPLNEADQMVLDNQLSIIREAVSDSFKLPKSRITSEILNSLRRLALDEDANLDNELNTSLIPGVSKENIISFIELLRHKHHISLRAAAAHKERMTRTGFTLAEQLFTIETSLRMMGLTENFARIVLICAHGSKSDNNPFESALDCGACGGNEGQANARVFAAMANRIDVRNELAKKGINIPADTYFAAGQLSTSTDLVELFDVEDVPPTHRLDLMRLVDDLHEAGLLTSQERCTRLPDVGILSAKQASDETLRRSCDWSQVRPEWGLSNNAAFIIGRRQVSAHINMKGRVFLNSYDYTIDPDGKLLENLMTAAQTVCEWINMEHFFSTVDNDVFGAGSKIYHNVTAHVGVMCGTVGDLRIGLPEQTVMKGESPYHDPLRLTTIIEAPRQRIEMLIARHELLQRFYHNEWVHLVALAPDEKALYRYLPSGKWQLVEASISSN